MPPPSIKLEINRFCEIIEAEGIVSESEETINGEIVRNYKGINGEVIQISMSQGFIYNRVARAHMMDLGVDEMIINLFPID